jgi:putative photosynthetic complex assembly protein
VGGIARRRAGLTSAARATVIGEPVGDDPFPRGPLIGAALLIGFALLAAGLGRLNRPAETLVAAPVLARELRFTDQPDGSVRIVDVRNNAELTSFAPGTNNFARGILRALARQRRQAGVSPELPFRLAQTADGRLTIEDPATGERVDLGSFGTTNAGDFARLLR